MKCHRRPLSQTHAEVVFVCRLLARVKTAGGRCCTVCTFVQSQIGFPIKTQSDSNGVASGETLRKSIRQTEQQLSPRTPLLRGRRRRSWRERRINPGKQSFLPDAADMLPSGKVSEQMVANPGPAWGGDGAQTSVSVCSGKRYLKVCDGKLALLSRVSHLHRDARAFARLCLASIKLANKLSWLQKKTVNTFKAKKKEK